MTEQSTHVSERIHFQKVLKMLGDYLKSNMYLAMYYSFMQWLKQEKKFFLKQVVTLRISVFGFKYWILKNELTKWVKFTGFFFLHNLFYHFQLLLCTYTGRVWKAGIYTKHVVVGKERLFDSFQFNSMQFKHNYYSLKGN